MIISELKSLRESEDKIEFKEAKSNYPFKAGNGQRQEERRKCVLGYIVALANERGGKLVLGMTDRYPHHVTGTNFFKDNLGGLKDEVYNLLQIRVDVIELFEDDKRVVVINVPSRAVGKLLKFEGVPLMRTGESLRNMSDEEMYSILSEQEPDFSDKICVNASYDDLDENAIQILKNAYSRKQSNPSFLTLDKKQTLSDLGLTKNGKITNAALILLGKEESIKRFIPQAAIHLEYRNSIKQINFDNRHIFT